MTRKNKRNQKNKALVVGGQRRVAKKRATPRKAANSDRGIMLQMANSYIASLNDPFTFQGPRLGFGTLVPTAVNSMYYRGAVTSNADGTLALLIIPSVVQLLQFYDGGLNNAGHTSVAATDQSALQANFSSARVISMGLRCFPNIAATDAPGVSFQGAMPGMTINRLAAMTPADFISYPQGRIGIASNGSIATGRPQDPDSFIFYEQLINIGSGGGFSDDDDLPFSTPYVVYQGLPSDTVVYVEVVVNVEVIQLYEHSAAPMSIQQTPGPTLSSAFPSVERMWEYVSPKLGSVASNAITAIGNGLSSMIGSSAGKALGGTLGAAATRQLGSGLGRMLLM